MREGYRSPIRVPLEILLSLPVVVLTQFISKVRKGSRMSWFHDVRSVIAY